MQAFTVGKVYYIDLVFGENPHRVLTMYMLVGRFGGGAAVIIRATAIIH